MNNPTYFDMLLAIVGKDGQRYRVVSTTTAAASTTAAAASTTAATAEYPVADGVMDLVLAKSQPQVINLDELMRRPIVPAYLRMKYDGGIREAVFCPLSNNGQPKGALVIFPRKRGSIDDGLMALLGGIASLLSTVLMGSGGIRDGGGIGDGGEGIGGCVAGGAAGGVVGSGAAMREVFRSVSRVADTSASVLVLGETGTGKELIARAIHEGSPRKSQPMIRLNCAALPASLIESELFGHERGSFTGATDRRIGKFEQADKGTLFLDEIGELPLELQSKLLRALQEKEIERVGGRTTIKVDVRIIAATNRDLHQEVQTGNFRSDLFFRLNVFPIVIPPLRHRREDIPGLVGHFLEKHALKNKRVTRFSGKTLKELKAYSWPGNVRELEHLVERSMLTATGPTITQVLLPTTNELKQLQPGVHIPSLTELEREHIVHVLQICNGKVAGIGGAAEKLRIPSTTLFSKIRRLKIHKGYLND